jgi:hypothetical protein
MTETLYTQLLKASMKCMTTQHKTTRLFLGGPFFGRKLEPVAPIISTNNVAVDRF